MLFTEMGLSKEVLRGLDALGFKETTPIQGEVIPVLLEEKRDIIGLAQTGTGKTAAFGLPALENITLADQHPQLLILSPTRELCLQITRDLEDFSRYMNDLRIVSVYGGASIQDQIASLKRGAHVVVATPGRIHDLVRRKRIDLSEIQTLVLDEADEMLKMGFREDVDAILDKTPDEKNTLLFSATMSPGIAAITKNYMRNPLEITVGKKNAGAENVSHIYHMVHARDRYAALKRIVDSDPAIYGLIFCRTRHETKEVAANLMNDGYNAEALHGDLSQAQRDSVMKKFRSNNLNVLVATDVAARGLDVNNLSHVINYNLPDDNEAYTHRSGRTGRAGKEGLAVSIINTKEKGRIAQIEKMLQKKIAYMPVPNGKEICQRQLLSMAGRMQETAISHHDIEPLMEDVYNTLGDLSKEELIKRFVSLEFNRFLDYYKDAPDLNVRDKKAPERPSNGASKGDKKRRTSNGRPMSRVLFNLGKGKNVTKREIIQLCAGVPGARNVEIGQIEIFKRTTAVEVESRMANKIIGTLNNATYRGVRIEAEENEDFSGNDFRDRHKGPRGKKRRAVA
ncbi:MAG: DEAD/DEAH box helicase [Bacteroidales bacterium]